MIVMPSPDPTGLAWIWLVVCFVGFSAVLVRAAVAAVMATVQWRRSRRAELEAAARADWFAAHHASRRRGLQR